MTGKVRKDWLNWCRKRSYGLRDKAKVRLNVIWFSRISNTRSINKINTLCAVKAAKTIVCRSVTATQEVRQRGVNCGLATDGEVADPGRTLTLAGGVSSYAGRRLSPWTRYRVTQGAWSSTRQTGRPKWPSAGVDSGRPSQCRRPRFGRAQFQSEPGFSVVTNIVSISNTSSIPLWLLLASFK